MQIQEGTTPGTIRGPDETERPTSENRPSHLAKGAVAGAIAGLAGSAAMAMVMKGISTFGPNGAKEEARTMEREMDKTRTEVADRVSEATRDEPVPEKGEKPVSMAVHMATGALGGALYGAAAEMNDRVTLGHGLAYGTAFFLASREVALPALGLAPAPTEQFNPKSQAETLGLHLVYGLTAETIREPVRRALG